MKPSCGRTVAVCGMLALALIAFSGCEDQQARESATNVTNEVNKMKSQISALEAKNEELTQKLKGVEENFSRQISDRMEKASERVMAATNEAMQKITKESESTREMAKRVVENARGDYDKELAGAKATIAGDMQKIREEFKSTAEDLKKFMDNQLRELYPYAYQPKRLDPNTPPAPETK